MKTNEEILLIFHLMSEVVKVSTPDELKPFSYAFIKNKIRIKPIIEAKDEYVKSIIEMNKLSDEKDIQEFLQNDEGFNKFLKEDSGIELYTIKLDSLEGKEFNLVAVDALIGNIIEEN